MPTEAAVANRFALWYHTLYPHMFAQMRKNSLKPVNEVLTFRDSDHLLSAFEKGFVELTIYNDGGTKVVERSSEGKITVGYDFHWEEEIY